MGMEKADWQDVEKTIRSVIDNNFGAAPGYNLRLKGLEIFADSWLKKVFFNITDAMIRYGIQTKNIQISCKESEKGLHIFFEGEGKGIPHDQKERLFEHGYGGTNGFGLFLAREILAITGITIRETGEPGKNLRFDLQVPKRVFRFTEEFSLHGVL